MIQKRHRWSVSAGLTESDMLQEGRGSCLLTGREGWNVTEITINSILGNVDAGLVNAVFK